MKDVKTVEEYILRFPEEIQEKLNQFRKVILTTAPSAVEVISYGIPTFKLNGKNLVHFGGFKNHISFFPTSSPIPVFKKELKKYKVSKGTIHFSLDEPLPVNLIKKITKFRVKEVSKKS